MVTVRCPTIIDSGRLGLLAILFEFIEDGKKVWVVGDGGNRYQFIYAQDLATACLLCLRYERSNLFHIGSDDVPTMRAMYEAVIATAGSTSRVARLPQRTTIALLSREPAGDPRADGCVGSLEGRADGDYPAAEVDVVRKVVSG